MINEAVARRTRQVIKAGTGLEVVAVPFIRRHHEHEFAALVIRNDSDMNRALEFLTDPRNPFVVSRETKTRIFIRANH